MRRVGLTASRRAASPLIHRSWPPHPRLAPHVERLWYLRQTSDATAPPDRISPDRRTELILSLRTPVVQLDATGRPVRQPPAMLIGQLSRFVLFQSSADIEILPVRFQRAGARAFFRTDLDSLTDRYAAPDQLDRSWRELATRLSATDARYAGKPAFVGLLSNGTSGNINNVNYAAPAPPKRAPGEQIALVARSVADTALHAPHLAI